MSLKLNSSGGGSVTLQEPVTASTLTLNLPAVNGTLATLADASSFPAGTVMLFAQTAAPTGWTKSTTHNDKALRVVSGTASSGGSVAFTTAFASQAVNGTVGNTTLTTTQIPSHSHSLRASTNVGGSGLTSSDRFADMTSTGQTYGVSGGNLTNMSNLINSAGSGGSHNHSFTGTAIDLAVQYVDVILASKD